MIRTCERNMGTYKRDIDQLREHAVLHWPDTILEIADSKSSLPRLLATQDVFLAVLVAASAEPNSWKQVLLASKEIYPNLFLKHLMVLADLGGEALNKLPPLLNYFESGEIKFLWGEDTCSYSFQEINEKCTLTNTALKVDAKKLRTASELTPKIEDVCMLLLFGSAAVNDNLPQEVKSKCNLGEFLGQPNELKAFIRQRYLHVSKQVSGATANALGHAVQEYVAEQLRGNLPANWKVFLDESLPNVSHRDDGKETNFDVVVISNNNKYFGVEVSFQVTTNSVIERKSREAQNMMKTCHDAGHKICYVVDGAGNINVRRQAVGIICENSDCTVAMSEDEMKLLADYMLRSV